MRRPQGNRPSARRAEGGQSSDAWNDRPVYWATLNYIRWWWATDGLRLGAIRRSRGFTPKVLRSMAVEYNVNRGIVSAKAEIDDAANGLCKLVNASSRKWPISLTDRADFCVNLLNRAINQQWVHGHQISLITKLMWFLRPIGWTPFDRFAASGLGIKPSAEPCRRMTQFYAALEGLSFQPLMKEMQAVVNGTQLNGLPATRIVDRLLMVRGGLASEAELIAASKEFLSLLPSHTRKTVEGVGSKLQKTFGWEPLLMPDFGKTA
jgi:hypothetical protein